MLLLSALILVPIAGAVITLLAPKNARFVREAVALAATALTLGIAAHLFGKEISFAVAWAGFGIDLTFRLYHFSSFIALAAAGFAVLVTLYACTFMGGRAHAGQFFAYLLLSLAFVNGAALSDNLIAMLFFWEGLLVTLFGMIAIGNKGAWKSATKALIIVGISDLCMMVGMAITGHLAGTLTISQISLPMTRLGGLAFVLLVIGAIAKAGSMPFHSWIPDAALDAPLPFMAILPASLEKLLGIYFLARVSLDMFKLDAHSWVSTTLMVIGSCTILFAVMMALIQKDYKRLLSYHAISQVGYMVLGIGTLVPAGIIGGLFHMINHALYKCCLFLTGGSVERQAGTTDLARLGGLARQMPVTFTCFVIAAASISGVPPFNGFFSKELIYDGALERGAVFYAAALIGSFLTAASFLKLGHAAYFGKRASGVGKAAEAPWAMLIPMIVIASLCVLFGLWNALPLTKLIQPILGAHRLEGHSFAGWPANPMLVVGTLVALGLALLNHLYGCKKGGSGLKAADHIHYAPGLAQVYNAAEKGRLDPYAAGVALSSGFGRIADRLDRAVDWIYNDLSVNAAQTASRAIRRLHNGSYKGIIAWSLAGGIAVVVYLLRQG